MHVVEPYLSLRLEQQKMKAILHQKEKVEKADTLSVELIIDYLQTKGVTYGLLMDAISTLVENQTEWLEPIEVAKGIEPVKGQDAYLLIAVRATDEANQHSVEHSGIIDLKQVLDIPSVKEGEKLAQKVAATNGEAGMNVLGEPVEPKRGKDFKLRIGKNTRIDQKSQTLYALVSGQMSMTKKTVHVYPVYQVKGDIGTRTGNIDFIGNVHVNGNVPSGFKIIAGGDIRVNGTIEGATIQAGGSIYVGAGIVGQNKSDIQAKHSLYTTFINEGNVKVGDSIYVTQSILHSHCYATTEIVCMKGKGNIVGGVVSAGFKIQANEFGNALHTKTDFYVGPSKQIVEQQRTMEKQLIELKDGIMKSSKLLNVLLEKEKRVGPLQGKEKIHKLRVLHFLKESITKRELLEESVAEMKEMNQSANFGFMKADKMIYPNVNVHFGKYRRKLTSSYSKSQIALMQNEITISSLK
ncbi:DUF342 domain-containing protein [Alkalihalobacillus pseudalcaliphilus]|uniref:DUF342 domain-containing protein n=1 Tax=Alkalihalobacillus pseudalcaliphilus TaxID=79884 RepID=UPI00064D7570|nr:FapA family protein [Alkalihalobacillus pseudalcaliphilus]KMK77237.1 hypothetical protein AB990_06740 [Alkalihalobacillus pseudalcaliphilus]